MACQDQTILEFPLAGWNQSPLQTLTLVFFMGDHIYYRIT